MLTGTGVRVGSIVHVDVGQDRDERTVACIGDALKCQTDWANPGEPASAEVAPELLAKQHFDTAHRHERRNVQPASELRSFVLT